MNYDYTGIILNKKDVGETDRMYFIYTKEAGVIKAMATGVRKPQSKLAGNLENFNFAHISIVRNKGMGKITGSIVESSFRNIKENYEILNIVFETINKFGKIVKEEEKDEDIFRLLLMYLDEMNRSDSFSFAQFLTQGFIFKLLDFSGYKIETDFCSFCGSKIKTGENYFNVQCGGFSCLECSSKLSNKITANENAIKIIRIFFENNLSSIKKLKVGENDIKQLRIISENFLHWTF